MKTISLPQAVELIPNGASLMVGGFVGVGSPERVIDELVRQGKRELTIIANDISVDNVLAQTETTLTVPGDVPSMTL